MRPCWLMAKLHWCHHSQLGLSLLVRFGAAASPIQSSESSPQRLSPLQQAANAGDGYVPVVSSHHSATGKGPPYSGYGHTLLKKHRCYVQPVTGVGALLFFPAFVYL